MENNQENIPPVIQPQITKQLNKKLIVLIIVALVGLASVYIIYPKSITSCGVLPNGPSCAKYVCWGIPMQGVGAPLCWGKLKLIDPTTPTQQVVSKDVIYGQVAEDVCGPQPPVLCQANMRLGCRVADKKWGCYPFSSETDVSWEIYRDEINGFEFQYPKNWIVEITGNKTLKNSLLIGPSGVDDRTFIMQAISIDISDSSKYSSLKSFAEQQAGREDEFVEKITLENTLINNTPAIKIHSADKSDYTRLVFFYGEKAFLLHDSGNLENKSNEFKNILSTFKFISSTAQNTEPDVWKIYRNEGYNFEFSYPQSWVLKDLMAPANSNPVIDSYDIAVGYTSPEQNAVRGITYCEAYSGQSPRCEIYKGFIIDWEYGGASINDTVGGTVGISLKKSGTESKDIFRKILSTFKFIK